MTDRLTELPVLGNPVCKLDSERIAGGWKQTTTLSLNVGNAKIKTKYAAFVVEDILGDTYLIGSKEPPYPVVKTSQNIGNPSGDAAGCFLEVIHSSLRSLIPCIFLK